MPQAAAAVIAFFGAVKTTAIATLGTLGLSKATAMAVVGFGGQLLATVAVNALATALAPRPKTGQAPGAPNDWRANPSAPVLNIWGYYGTGGYIVFQKPHGDGDKYLSTVSVLSLGPVHAIKRQWFGDEVLTETNPGTNGVVTGDYANAIWTRWQLGATPEATALPVLPNGASVPEWTSAHKISGFAAAMSTFDVSNTDKLNRGVQKARWDVEGHLCYDPRKDSTYPGGSGAHRIDAPATWEYTQNAWLCALKYSLGIRHNGVLRDGLDAPPETIVISDFVAGANWHDDNEWGLGGLTETTDEKGAVLSALMEAGGGIKIRRRGKLGAIVYAPSASVGTIGVGDIVGPVTIQRFKPFNEVYNTVIPRFNSEDHAWEQMAGTPVEIGNFVATDGRTITQEVSFPLVSDPVQAAQLAALRAWQSRISLVVTMQVKLHCWRYEAGECITLDLPGLGIAGVKMRITNPQLDLATMTVQVSMHEEMDAAYEDAVGKTTEAPPVIDMTPSGAIQAPIPAEWSLLTSHDGSIANITATGNLTNIASLTAIAVYYRVTGDPDWIFHASGPVVTLFSVFITELTRSTDYDIGVQYVRAAQTSAIITVGSIETS